MIMCLLRIKKRRRFYLVTLSVYFLTFCVILPILLRDLPLTKYYHLWHTHSSILTEARTLNEEYADAAVKALSSLPRQVKMGKTFNAEEKTAAKLEQNNVMPELAIGVITVPRHRQEGTGPRYLTQVMVALGKILKTTNITTVFMCNTHRPAEEHKEAVDLSAFFPLASPFKTSPETEKNQFEREKRDYVYCLSKAEQLSSKYALLIEDDALPHPDFYSVLKHILTHKIEVKIKSGEPQNAVDDFLWLKLNFPTVLAKYERNYYFALEWISLSAVLASAFTLVLSSCPVFSYRSKENFGYGYISVSFFMAFAYFMLLIWTIGRSNINLSRTLSESFYTLCPGTACCTPAVLYPKSQIPGIVGYLGKLRLSTSYPLDYALEDYRLMMAHDHGLRQYLVNPNLFTHIGIVSALHWSASSRTAEGYLFGMNYLKRKFKNFYAYDTNH